MSKIFSGMRPSGKLHLGNYLGAIKNWIALQDEPDTTQSIFAAVDLHGITTPYDPKTFSAQVTDVLLDYVAAGVNPTKSLIIRQSHIPEHAELMWLLSTITPVGWLERLPNWREKIEQVEDMGDRGASYRNNLSLLSYPVLMAADILLYKSDTVPVGDDQLPHIELTNEVGAKFNHLFGNIFPNVKGYVAQGARIMSLTDPTKKMSKTGDDGIALTDSPDDVRGKIKRATTDSGKEIKFDETEKPGISNLLTIYSTLSGKPVGELEQDYDGKSYGDFKSDLGEVVVGFLKPFQERRAALAADMPLFERVLTESEEKARIIATENLTDIRRSMGLR
jgi:tryptophanyl-tRNA synthetase